MIILRETDYVPVPWKNGGGLTHEICRAPPASPSFDWRLSLATIERAGPFSAFGGYERTLVLARGAGLELSFGPHGQARLSRVGQFVSFDGGWESTCNLLGGTCADLNLIASKERIQSRSRVVHAARTELIPAPEWPERLICCLDGAVDIETAMGSRDTLAAIDVARCSPEDGLVTCRSRSSDAAQLFIAEVRYR